MDKFRLSWSDHHAMLQTVFARLLVAEQFVDITLSCSGRNIRCHRVVLSACSSYFEGLLTSNQCPHPIIVMRDVTFEEMSDLVNFMYFGEVTVEEEKLPSLLKTAEFLEIKGLGSNSTSDISTDIDKKVSSSEKLADNRKRPGSSLSKSSEKRSTKQKVEPEEVDSFNGTNEYSDVATLPSAFAIKKSRKQTHVTQPLDNSTADDSFGADWNPDDLNESTKNNDDTTIVRGIRKVRSNPIHPEKAVFIRSSRARGSGRGWLTHRGYQFRNRYTNQQERGYWNCRHTGCTSRAVTDSDMLVSVGLEHNHDPLQFDLVDDFGYPGFDESSDAPLNFGETGSLVAEHSLTFGELSDASVLYVDESTEIGVKMESVQGLVHTD